MPNKTNIIQEKNYLFAKTINNDIHLIMEEKEGDPQNPEITYDGKEHALF